MSVHSANQAATAVVAVLTILVSLAYIAGLYFLYRHAKQHPKALNRASSVHLQRYAPVVYAFLIFCSIVEIAIGSWLLVVYRNSGSYPNLGARNGMCLCIFSGCWTMIFSTIYVIFFVHPTFSKHPVVSVGAQSLWALVSWSFWVACTAVLNGSLPLATSGVCLGITYCSQIQALFAFCVIDMLVLTLGMLVLGWLVWRQARESLSSPLPR